jgi:hypothetical protein
MPSRYIPNEEGKKLRTFSRDGSNITHVQIDNVKVGEVRRVGKNCEVHPIRGASVNAPSIAEGARILLRMHVAGWI